MSSLDSILWDLGYREKVECYGSTRPTLPKTGLRFIAEKMVNSYHAHGFEPGKMTILPIEAVPHSEAYKRNLPFAIYSAP